MRINFQIAIFKYFRTNETVISRDKTKKTNYWKTSQSSYLTAFV